MVSVVFCDVVGSTALGESTDPEAVRALLARYFEMMRGIVESHGGSVEKFIGDAVMAVFGVPAVHEDDAVRACRAAVEMRDAFPALGIEGRIGVASGEVVSGTEERLATGDTVNVAARLQQAAEPGEILIADVTRALAGGAVDVVALRELLLKGKRDPVPVFRLVDAREAPERRHDMPFVGRDPELAAVVAAWDRVLGGRSCELFTIVGEAGLGKSRLVAEALGSIDARVVRGRCLPYGSGITYWPVVEVVKQLNALPSEPAAVAAIRSLLGETAEGTSADEIGWAFRRLLEEQAPLVVVFDDIQWGEETFLDLVEHLALLSAGAPILLLCMARPELLDSRPAWPAWVRLEPLSAEEAAGLIGSSVTDELRTRIAASAGGNPLFISEMLGMTHGDTDIVVPSSLKALLAARLDQLDPAERRVLERGSVEGEVFHRGVVQALAPEEGQVTTRLAALVRRELIRPERALFEGEDGFRFRHLLLRDAAYDALPKAVRAELHSGFAAWLERRGDLVELDEIVGFHLEQAARYKNELGRPDPVLALRAGARLAAAGRNAGWRGDNRAADRLFGRALKLTRPIRLDVMLELDHANAISDRDAPRAAAVASAAIDRARDAGDATGELLARVGAGYYRLRFEADPPVDEVEALAREALPRLEQAGDHAALSYLWFVLGFGVANFRSRFDDWAHAAGEELRHARLAGRRTMGFYSVGDGLVFGSTPADEALSTLDGLLPENPHPWPLLCRAWLLTMLGRFLEADELAKDASRRLLDLTDDVAGDAVLGQIAATAGRYEDAAVHLRRYCDVAEARGLRGFLSTFAPMLGRCLCFLDRYDEAEPLARLGRELGDEHDVLTAALWRQVQALVDAHRGNYATAEQLAREAVEKNYGSDGLNHQGDAFFDLATVLELAGRPDDAAAALADALDRYDRKRNLAQAAVVRDRLAALRH